MRIPIPERLPPRGMLIFGAVIFVAQQIAGTDFTISMLTAVFIGLWTAAFNAAGGIVYTSGAFIFFNGFFTVILAAIGKAVLFEPLQRNMQAPVLTMACYCVGMAMMGVAAYLCRAFRPAKALLQDFESLQNIKQAAFACLIIGILLVLTAGSADTASGSFTTAIRQINRFPFMVILLGTVYEIRVSGGKRSWNWIVVAGIAFNFAFGLLYFSKEGMLIGPTAWFLAAWLSGYDFPRIQLAACVLGVAFTTYYLVPYSQYVRVFTTTSKTENLAIALKYLSDLPETRRLYLESAAAIDLNDAPHLFDERISLLDRAVIVTPDDAIISYTAKGNIFGLQPIILGWANVVPRFIWSDKPAMNFGNVYAHEMGGWLAEEDTTTGISVSPTADAFHEASWLGLLLLLPANLFIAFLVIDSLVGNVRYSVWALLPILEMTHLAAEDGLSAAAYMSTYSVIAILFVVVVCKRLVPLVFKVFRPETPVPLEIAPAARG